MTICAAAGCTNPVQRRHQHGRPPLYCSPTCRRRAARVSVEVDHQPGIDGRPAGRVWLVRLRQRRRSVVIADGLGRPSAECLAQQIAHFLTTSPSPRRGGDAIR